MPQSNALSRAHKNEPVTNWRELLAEGKKALAKAVEIRVHPSKIYPLEGQPRTHFNEESIRLLVEAIDSVGQVYPGIVRIGNRGEGTYEILDGERRWRAISRLNIPYRALRVEISNEAVPFLIAAMANFNREAHTPLEISDTIDRMYSRMQMPIEEIAKILGMKSEWAYQMLSLRNLHEKVRAMLDPTLPKDKRIAVTAAIQISKMDPSVQYDLARRAVKREVSIPELRKEAVRVSKERGTYIRTRRDAPWARWQSIGRRTNQFRRMADDLRGELSTDDMLNIVPARYGGFSIDQVLDSVREASKALQECEQKLMKLRSRK